MTCTAMSEQCIYACISWTSQLPAVLYFSCYDFKCGYFINIYLRLDIAEGYERAYVAKKKGHDDNLRWAMANTTLPKMDCLSRFRVEHMSDRRLKVGLTGKMQVLRNLRSS